MNFGAGAVAAGYPIRARTDIINNNNSTHYEILLNYVVVLTVVNILEIAGLFHIDTNSPRIQ